MLYSVHTKANTLKNNCLRKVSVLRKFNMINLHSFGLIRGCAVVY